MQMVHSCRGLPYKHRCGHQQKMLILQKNGDLSFVGYLFVCVYVVVQQIEHWTCDQ